MKVRAVFFDLGGVFYTEGFREGLYSIARKLGVNREDFHTAAMDLVFSTGYVTGAATEREFWRRLAGEFQLEDELYLSRDRILSAFKRKPDMTLLARETRQSVPVALLTDQTNWLYELNERDGFLSEFDSVISSYEEGYSKRDFEIFRIACQRLGVFPEETVFFDDNAGNVRRAEEFGIPSYLFIDSGKARKILTDGGLL